MHRAQPLDVGQEAADAGAGRRAGRLERVTDEDDTVLPAVVGDGYVRQPVLDRVDDLEIADRA